MTTNMKIFSLRRLLLAVALLTPIASFAVTQAGLVLVATAGVKAVGGDGAERVLTRRSPIYSGDKLVTGSAARVQIKFSDGSIMALKPNTEMSVDKYLYEPQGAQAMLLSLAKGGFRTVTGAIGKIDRKAYKIATPIATIGVRGTLHEGDFNPQSGLALAVWDGGTEACNSTGCLELGTGADFRFGFIGLDGKKEGRNTPPAGIGDETGVDDAGDDESPDDELAEQESEQEDDVQGLFIEGDADDFLGGPRSKFTGFAVVGGLLGNATQYPWGSQRLLDIQDADVRRVSGDGDYFEIKTMHSITAGGFINPGFAGAGGYLPQNPHFEETQDQKSLLIWGTWAGVDPVSGIGDMSFSSVPEIESDAGIPAAGFYAFATTPAPDVIADLTGKLNFELLYLPNAPSMTFPQFFDASSSGLQYASAASGQFMIDVASADVIGSLDFTSGSTGDSWHLVMGGQFANRKLDVSLVAGQDGSTTSGSWYMPVDSTAGSELGVTGVAKAELVGSAATLGLLGAFDVMTIDTADSNFANGIFFMRGVPEIPLPTFSGFAALGGTAGPYPWGSAPVLVLDDARLSLGLDGSGNTVVLDHSLYSVAAGNKFILPGSLDAVGGASTLPPAPYWTSLAADPAVRVAWGGWLGGDVSLSNVDNGIFTSDAITDPGTFVFGDWASPAVIANLSGTVDFSLEPQFPMFVDASGVPQTAVSSSGVMLVDVSTGMVIGGLTFQTSSADQWDIAYNGAFNAQSAQPLTLTVLGDPVSPLNASHFTGNAGSGAPLEVSGTIQASFIGLTNVAGVVGAFDVQTVDTSDANMARGVFAMGAPVP